MSNAKAEQVALVFARLHTADTVGCLLGWLHAVYTHGKPVPEVLGGLPAYQSAEDTFSAADYTLCRWALRALLQLREDEQLAEVRLTGDYQPRRDLPLMLKRLGPQGMAERYCSLIALIRMGATIDHAANAYHL